MKKVNHLMKAMRADISALLLIAFLFQLLTPVVVLAGNTPSSSDFETALRTSICRVDVGNDENGATPSHTDGFVCEFCVLCHIDVHQLSDFLPEVVFHSPLAGLPQPYGKLDEAKLALSTRRTPLAPRAPPQL